MTPLALSRATAGTTPINMPYADMPGVLRIPPEMPSKEFVNSWVALLVEGTKAIQDYTGAVWKAIYLSSGPSVIGATLVPMLPPIVSFDDETTGFVWDSDISEAAVLQVGDLVQSISQRSGLSKQDIAERLLGKTRQAVAGWVRENQLPTKQLEKLLAIEAVLEFAWDRQNIEGPGGDLRWWLLAPRGADGKTAADAIKDGDFALARLYAVTIAPEKHYNSPEWIQGRPSVETAALIRAKKTVLSTDAVPPD